MLKFKKYFIFIGVIILFYLFISLLYLQTNIPYNIISSIILIFNLVAFAILGFIITKKSNNKGIIMGLRIGSIIIISLFILSLVFRCDFNIKNILYYLLVMLSTMFGSIFSKNLKK